MLTTNVAGIALCKKKKMFNVALPEPQIPQIINPIICHASMTFSKPLIISNRDAQYWQL